MNDLIQHFGSMDPVWIYCTIFFIAYIENIFPPAPSDVAVVFAGALAAVGTGHYVPALIAGTVGSTLGFMTMYAVGKWFGHKIVEQNKLKFISRDLIKKIDQWFEKYGYWIIVANRFLAGTRAVVSFVAGLSELHFVRTTLLSLISSLAWYGILIYAGYSLGSNWEKIGTYLSAYAQIITGLIVVIVAFVIIRSIRKNQRSQSR